MVQEQKDLLLRDITARIPYGVKILHEWEIHEEDLPWWFFWIHPSDNLIFQHYGYVCYGGYEYEDIPKRYRKYARKINQIR